jgi:hypothetical protein
MAKPTNLALKYGHLTPFRRTVQSGGKTKVLTFEPGYVYPIPAAELPFLQKAIDSGLLVEACSDRRHGGAPTGDPTKTVDAKAAEIETLTALLAERDARIAELEQQVKDYDELLSEEGDEEEDDDE